jgi:AraC family transcriptional regulator, ethanolamine operon transcriptional activator
MLFQHLSATAALDCRHYGDLDRFRESERYARAESMPLLGQSFSVMRADMALPYGKLSLVRTFPRIITGYDLCGQLIVVIPMDGVSSTRLNGRSIGQSLILMKGKANCTVLEPEGRLVAIISLNQSAARRRWPEVTDGYLLLSMPVSELARLQRQIAHILRLAAARGDLLGSDMARQLSEDALLAQLDDAIVAARNEAANSNQILDRYKAIIDRVDEMVMQHPMNLSNSKVADAVGVSVRTLQTASFSICGSGVFHYTRLKRLWSVRRQLSTGAPGLTVKASAHAHGFWHQSEFSNAYLAVFGELPSLTLADARMRERS